MTPPIKKETLRIQSLTANLEKIRKFVSGLAEDAGFNEDDVGKIELAVDEACANVVRHAYSGDTRHSFDITIEYDQKEFTVTVKDKGKGFDPSKLQKPDLEQYLKEHKVGGLGIHLMNELMDEVEFSINPGEYNRVTLKKFVS